MTRSSFLGIATLAACTWLLALSDARAQEDAAAREASTSAPAAALTDLSSETAELTSLVDEASGTAASLKSGAVPGEFSGDVDAIVAADALLSTKLIGNRVEDIGGVKRSVIHGSFGANRGIVNVNQSSGNLDAQANLRAIALGQGHAVLPVAGLTTRAEARDNVAISRGGARENRIENAFDGSAGLVGVNQTAGNLNQQSNVAVIALGIGLDPDVPALGEVDLAEVSADNESRRAPGQQRTEVLSGSFAGFRGVAQVSQAAGDGNIVGNSFTLSAGVR